MATTAPSIQGNVQVGSRVTANPGVWSEEGLTFNYQWLRDGQPIAGATSESYRITRADRGTSLSVQVATAATGPAGVAVSAASQVQEARANAIVIAIRRPIVGTTRTNFTPRGAGPFADCRGAR